MPVIKVKSTTNARRQYSVLKNNTDKKKREKSLCFGMAKNSGRNNRGVITAQNRGGGFRKIYRNVDFKQTAHLGKKAEVVAVEYDPNRTANILLVKYEDDTKSYLLAPSGIKTGNSIICDDSTPIKTGNRLRIKNIPASTQIYNVELDPGRGGQIAKSAGNYVILLGTDDEFSQIKMPSGEVRKLSSNCFASIGVVSNIEHNKVTVSKAGRFRLMGKRPHVRGKAKNPCDHPHGGGEGNTSIGMVRPKTPWGMPALGHKTRKKKKPTSELIVRRRK